VLQQLWSAPKTCPLRVLRLTLRQVGLLCGGGDDDGGGDDGGGGGDADNPLSAPRTLQPLSDLHSLT
jgi:hypothetical protein